MTDIANQLLLASVRTNLADYFDKLVLIYMILIFVRIIISWIPRIPYNSTLQAVLQFIHDITDPYLRIFRRLLPPIGDRIPLDLSPLIALIVLIILRAVVPPLIAGG